MVYKRTVISDRIEGKAFLFIPSHKKKGTTMIGYNDGQVLKNKEA